MKFLPGCWSRCLLSSWALQVVFQTFFMATNLLFLSGPACNLFLRKLHFKIGSYIVDKFTSPGVRTCDVWKFVVVLSGHSEQRPQAKCGPRTIKKYHFVGFKCPVGIATEVWKELSFSLPDQFLFFCDTQRGESNCYDVSLICSDLFSCSWLSCGLSLKCWSLCCTLNCPKSRNKSKEISSRRKLTQVITHNT